MMSNVTYQNKTKKQTFFYLRKISHLKQLIFAFLFEKCASNKKLEMVN